MQVSLSTDPWHALAADVLIHLAFEEAAPRLGVPADASVAALYESGEFQGKPLDFVLVHNPEGLAARRLLLVGAGKTASFGTSEMRTAAGAAVRHLKGKGFQNLAFALTGEHASAAHLEAVVQGALLGEYEPDQLKTDPTKAERRFNSFTVAAPNGPGLETALEKGRVLGESQNFTRDLVNTPANLLYPLELARRAEAMAGEAGLECEILDEARMRQLGMGSLLGVSMGSSQPPAFVVLRYRPATASPEGVHLGLVGKGVTFDSGGISIKPADGMEKMKYDMAGAAAVLGAMRAIALLKPALTVTAFVPTVENMISGRAQRPGDIVTSLSGKTVEVLNTDAEGRLILNDALTYAQRLGCTHLVDAATLTGAIAVALGGVRAGAFTNNQPFLDRLLGAAAAQGEKMWQMPLDDEYKEQLKSAFADLPNIGTRWGGAVTAAYFLKEFADPTPWVHLDIAGTAWLDEPKPALAKGPSGICVRTFVELALGWKT
jgi:leucyl aminopeptidase